jgi:hypothetical protein
VIDLESANNAGLDIYSLQDDRSELGRHQKQLVNLWLGESFYGTASSRVYGLGSIRPSKSGGSLENPRESKDRSINDDAALANSDKTNGKKRATEDNFSAGGKEEIPRKDLDEAAVIAEWKKKEEAVLKKRASKRRPVEDEKRLLDERKRVANLLADAENKLAQQLERMEEERRQTKAELARAARESVEAEKWILIWRPLVQ